MAKGQKRSSKEARKPKKGSGKPIVSMAAEKPVGKLMTTRQES